MAIDLWVDARASTVDPWFDGAGVTGLRQRRHGWTVVELAPWHDELAAEVVPHGVACRLAGDLGREVFVHDRESLEQVRPDGQVVHLDADEVARNPDPAMPPVHGALGQALTGSWGAVVADPAPEDVLLAAAATRLDEALVVHDRDGAVLVRRRTWGLVGGPGTFADRRRMTVGLEAEEGVALTLVASLGRRRTEVLRWGETPRVVGPPPDPGTPWARRVALDLVPGSAAQLAVMVERRLPDPDGLDALIASGEPTRETAARALTLVGLPFGDPDGPVARGVALDATGDGGPGVRVVQPSPPVVRPRLR